MTFTDLHKSFERFNAEKIVESVYDRTKEELLDLNTDQLKHGLTTAGSNFPGYVIPEYAAYKNALNPLPGKGNPDLKLTGDFYSSLKATYSAGFLEIVSTDAGSVKVAKLERWYGEQFIYGLTDAYRAKHVEENILPVLKDEIEVATGLTMQ